MYFKAQLEVGKHKDERIMHISARDIIHAMDITKKIRNVRRLVSLSPISYEDYMKGVDKKYDK